MAWRSGWAPVIATGACALPAQAQLAAAAPPIAQPGVGDALRMADLAPGGLALALLLGAVLVAVSVWRLIMLRRIRAASIQPAYAGIQNGAWPELTVFVAACGEPQELSRCIQALLNADYPAQRLRIVPVSDQPPAPTRAVIDAYAHLFPQRIQPHYRESGVPGQAAALQEAQALARGDIAIVVDAGYLPSPGLLKQLALPFFDPEVGAVMGRVVQMQAASGLLSSVLGRLLRLDALAGEPEPRQASLYLKAVPDGNTVGGVRLSAVVAVGGWHDSAFDAHADTTVRLLSNGWKTVYNHRAECLRAVPAARPAVAAAASRAGGSDGGSGHLITTEGPRRVRLEADRRSRPTRPTRPLQLRPMPTLHTGRWRAWRQALMRPSVLLAAGFAAGLHLLGAGWLLSAALPMTALLVLLAARSVGPASGRR